MLLPRSPHCSHVSRRLIRSLSSALTTGPTTFIQTPRTKNLAASQNPLLQPSPRTLSSKTTTTTMASSSSSSSPSHQITPIRASDYDQWAPLFKAYVDFYKSSLPEEQYPKTFARLVDPKTDLYGLVLRHASDENKLLGIAHYFPHQTPWNEKAIMHLNDLFVDPSLRGQGWGRKMIQEVARIAEADGCLRLQWATQHGNPARKLYDELAVCDFVEYRLKWQ